MTNTTSPAAGTTLWIALVAGLSVFGSFAYACAAPVAAVAALAAMTLNRTEGLVLVAATWAINQAVGFVLLSYPHDASTYAWGVTIGAAMVLGYFAARPLVRANLSWLVTAVAAFQNTRSFHGPTRCIGRPSRLTMASSSARVSTASNSAAAISGRSALITA